MLSSNIPFYIHLTINHLTKPFIIHHSSYRFFASHASSSNINNAGNKNH